MGEPMACRDNASHDVDLGVVAGTEHHHHAWGEPYPGQRMRDSPPLGQEIGGLRNGEGEVQGPVADVEGYCSRSSRTGQSTRPPGWPPPSGPSCAVAIPDFDQTDDDQAYRAMDLLVEADTDAIMQEAVFFAARTCSTSRSHCCCSTPPTPTSNVTSKIPTP